MAQKQKILMYVADEYEDIELQYPKYRLLEGGKEVVIAGEDKNMTYKGKHGYPCKPHISFNEVVTDQYEALVIAGGYAPDKLRKIAKVLEITRQFDQQKKLIAFICHAGSVLVSANIIKGIKCTSYSSIKDDMVNAGAQWEDSALVVDQHFISSRYPDDLPFFCPAILKYLSEKQK